MNISPDGVIVSFKTEPQDLFEAEKSGAKSNTVRILDKDEYQQLKKGDPKKIIIQHQQELFLRTLTHIHLTEYFFGRIIAIFSWTNEKHHHPILNEDPDPKAHTMSLDDLREPQIDLSQTAISIPRTLLADLNWNRGKDTLPEFISKLLNDRIGGDRR